MDHAFIMRRLLRRLFFIMRGLFKKKKLSLFSLFCGFISSFAAIYAESERKNNLVKDWKKFLAGDWICSLQYFTLVYFSLCAGGMFYNSQFFVKIQLQTAIHTEWKHEVWTRNLFNHSRYKSSKATQTWYNKSTTLDLYLSFDISIIQSDRPWHGWVDEIWW